MNQAMKDLLCSKNFLKIIWKIREKNLPCFIEQQLSKLECHAFQKYFSYDWTITSYLRSTPEQFKPTTKTDLNSGKKNLHNQSDILFSRLCWLATTEKMTFQTLLRDNRLGLCSQAGAGSFISDHLFCLSVPCSTTLVRTPRQCFQGLLK